jgi:hypothetical protein
MGTFFLLFIAPWHSNLIVGPQVTVGWNCLVLSALFMLFYDLHGYILRTQVCCVPHTPRN